MLNCFRERQHLQEFRDRRTKKDNSESDDVSAGFSRPFVDDGATKDDDEVLFMYVGDAHDEH